jgi:hypothetical protein
VTTPTINLSVAAIDNGAGIGRVYVQKVGDAAVFEATYSTETSSYNVADFSVNNSAPGEETKIEIFAEDGSFWKNTTSVRKSFYWKDTYNAADREAPTFFVRADDAAQSWKIWQDTLIVSGSSVPLNFTLTGGLQDASPIDSFTVNGNTVVPHPLTGDWTYEMSTSTYETELTFYYMDSSGNNNVGRDTVVVLFDYENTYPTNLDHTSNGDGTITLT